MGLGYIPDGDDGMEHEMPSEAGVQGRSCEMDRCRPDLSRARDIREELDPEEGLTFRKRI